MPEQTRRDKERALHRRLILEAAESVFAQKGYHSATVQEIAEKAEFSVGSLYNFFENKRDLYCEIFDMRAEEFAADVKERLAREATVIGKIREAIRAKLDFFRRRQDLFQMFASLHAGEEVEGPVIVPEKARSIWAEHLNNLADIVSEGIREGTIVPEDPGVLVLCIEALTDTTLHQWVYAGGKGVDLPDPEVVERLLFNGILVGEGSGR
jgi:AcrR family transcriptional regulator